MEVHVHILLLFLYFLYHTFFHLKMCYSYFSTDKADATIKITACGYYNQIKQSS